MLFPVLVQLLTQDWENEREKTLRNVGGAHFNQANSDQKP